MLGAIIGDTVGSIYEFCNIKSTQFPLFSAHSEPTDDSIMTMAVAEWLLSDPEPIIAEMRNRIDADWWDIIECVRGEKY
jgi:ADP-ribosylglycohydrolase